MNKRKILLTICFLIVGIVFVNDKTVWAGDLFDNPAEVDIIIRDSGGRLLKDINFEVYHEEKDADGKVILGKRVASGNTGETGRKRIKINVKPFMEAGTGNSFVFKIYGPNSKNAPFYFWGHTFVNNSFPTKTFRLGTTKFIISDAQGNLLRKRIFTLYRKEASEDCGCLKNIKVFSTSLGDKVCRKFYLPKGDYLLEVSLDNGLVGTKDFVISSDSLTIVNYVASNFRIILRDSQGNVLIKKKFDIYQQDSDVEGKAILGRKIGSYTTEATGKKDVFLPPGSYIIRFLGNKGQIYTLYNQELFESLTNLIDYTLSSLRITYLKEADITSRKYNIIKGSIAEQKKDAANHLVTGKILAGFKVNKNEFQDLYLIPGRYAIIINKEKIFNIDIFENKQSFFTVRWVGDKFVYKFQPPKEKKKPQLVTQLFYGKKRLSDLAEEKRRALILKQALEKILGRGRIGVPARYWHILVNSYIYGEYTPAEIADTIKRGPQAVHPTIPAPIWRKSKDYAKYLQRVG